MTNKLHWPLPEQYQKVSRSYDDHIVDGSGAPGIDLPAELGTPIYAVWPGQIFRSRFTNRAGRSIWLNVGNVRVFYSHLHHIFVLEGEDVEAGEIIGSVGCSGICETPHLHLSIKWHGGWVDPLRLLLGKPMR